MHYVKSYDILGLENLMNVLKNVFEIKIRSWAQTVLVNLFEFIFQQILIWTT